MAKTISAGVFIVRKDKKILVGHPTNHPPNFWSIPKGKVEDGETFLEAAIRETYEETNVDLNKLGKFKIYPLASVNYKHKKKILYPFVFLEEFDSRVVWDFVELKCNSNVPENRGGFPEMDELKWVTLEESIEILHATQVACLTKIKELL
jgi:8-oxo-dGTP pyrophosphatase MutT (NUDIX family)